METLKEVLIEVSHCRCGRFVIAHTHTLPFPSRVNQNRVIAQPLIVQHAASHGALYIVWEVCDNIANCIASVGSL